MKILVDIASIAKRALLAGEDKHNGYYEYLQSEGKEVLINSATYGLDNLCKSFESFFKDLEVYPKDVVLVMDGVNGTQIRKSINSTYKSGRSKPQGFYREYNNMMTHFTEIMLGLGAQTARYDGVEADDLIGFFCDTITEDQILVWSNDKDLLICAKNPNVHVYYNRELNPLPYGNFPYEFIDVYKATVGDASDNISGAKGFGPKAFEKMYEIFGDNGLRVLRAAIQKKGLAGLSEDVAALPQLQKLIDYAPDVQTSLALAELKTYLIKPEKIIWSHGVCQTNATVHPFLKDFSQQVTGVTALNFEMAFDEIKELAKESEVIALDIETSTPEESDNWLFDIKGEKHNSVDVYGSRLTGISLTMGGNFHRTFYFSVDHRDTPNVEKSLIENVLKYLNPTHRFVIHNVNFELPVLHNEFGWFLRDVDDTKMMASYVDENSSLALKTNSLRWLGYEQDTYEDTLKKAATEAFTPTKMNHLTLQEVLHYGADDTICTAALYQWFQLHMMLEQVWQVYRDVEIGAAYWVAQAFLDGADIDQVTLAKMISRDAQAKTEQEKILFDYLTEQGWEGSVLEEADESSRYTPKWIKYAFEIVTGRPLETSVRRFERLVFEVREQGAETLATLLESEDLGRLNQYVRTHFSGTPAFNTGSPKQMQHLMYEVMQLPVRLRNKPTDLMRLKGQDGTPQTDDVAINSALHYDLPDADDPRRAVLNALLKLKMYNTREGLYYKTYPKLPHWSDRKIRSSMNQCATVTRRFSSSNPKLNWASQG
ncbi:hypothetical protein CRG49_002045 [Neisseria sp. N95_16]|uniref:5'-3' exonuclease domain-containing protein n=1 Tax=Neisseria brasiliensis TaxID=2666100 RepID=A0A7X2KZ11_9NEIS|nr:MULTISPECIES: hypothetical protein [Neisseria]MRN38569.1 hypothetical protein [Neisseria brasiliensis]PJO10486.1 hypothetical protein CRG49_002045 [Neisseria sp. N95_16]